MNFTKMVRSLDIHVAGWPLRIITDFASLGVTETITARAERLWHAENSPVRWIQREPRGHAALRVGVVTASSRADAGLIVYDAEGPCRTDEWDALCASEALSEMGVFRRTDEIGWETAEGTIKVSAESEEFHCRTIRGVDHFNRQYNVLDSSVTDVPLRAANAAKLEQSMRNADGSSRKVLLAVDQKEENSFILAVAARDGKLLRAPEGGAVVAALAAIHGRNPILGVPLRFHGLSGGWVEGIVLGVEEINGARKLEWELRARARLIGSCEFVYDPSDPLGEGFLLR
ncbi:hypothetical protein D7Z26_12035 [Cohnella endophytica]|uniref:Uncharacterized protein n=1 Tax=Cohnella endophytica TaxID=2419778 RepID=A0A494XU60_9BACL|nr:proline racemase family protein [Cohnella endophytica]RKP54108.1 hypothetical protein D7Z26_12035 [Cohnella endophytica]